MSETLYNNDDNIHNDYGIFIDTDDNNYFIRKYSDENIPIYNKTLQNSPKCIISENYDIASLVSYNNYIHLTYYKLKRNRFLCLRILVTSVIVYIAYTIYTDTFYSVSLM
jgi:hypothetical protein